MECHDLVRPFCLFLAEMSGGFIKRKGGGFAWMPTGKVRGRF